MAKRKPKDKFLYSVKVRKELIDYSPEYLKDLKANHPEEYEYLAKFIDEYVNANVLKTKSKKRKDGTTIYGSGKVRKGQLHNTAELAKDVYDANNRRNNDVLGVARANRLMNDIDTEVQQKDGWYVTNPELTEDAMISDIDENEQVLSKEEFLELKDNLTPEMLLFYLALYELE